MRQVLTASAVLLALGCTGDTTPTDDPPIDTDTVTDTGVTPTGDTATETTETTTELTEPGWKLHASLKSVAYVAWEQATEEDVHVEYSFDKDVWLSSPSKPATVGLNERILLGIPFSTTAQWRVVSKSTTQDFSSDPILTEAPPPRLPLATLTVGDEENWYQEANYLLTSVNSNTGGWGDGTYFTVILDRKGRAVWAHPAPQRNWTLYAQVGLAGDHIMWDEATAWSDGDDGAASQIHRHYLDEKDSYEQIDAPGLHHAWIQLPDGTLTWGSLFHNPGTETLVELAPGAKTSTEVWNCQDDWVGVGYCESNSIFYSPERDTYLYSFYTNDTLVEIDKATGTTQWWAGSKPNGLDFVPRSSEFYWQHGVSWTDAGTLLVSTDAEPPGSGKVTILREYTIDEKTGTLTQVWSHNEGIYADTNGAAKRLPNGNTLHIVGSGGEAYEVDPKGTVVWHVDYNSRRLLGDGEYIADLYALVSPKAR